LRSDRYADRSFRGFHDVVRHICLAAPVILRAMFS
jgi:hypothetical protein